MKPHKNRAGNRTYRHSDIDLSLYIKDLLYNKKFTIEGARHQLANEKDSKKENIAGPVESAQPTAPARKETLLKIKQELETLLEIVRREIYRSVAQSGSARDWGSRGREFKSRRSDRILTLFS